MSRLTILARIARLRALMSITHTHALQVKARLKVTKDPAKRRALNVHLEKLTELNVARRTQVAQLQPKPAPRVSPQLTMFDTIEVSTVPGYAKAVAGYVGGHWPTYDGLVKRFPHAYHLSIAISASEDAHCLDVEPGDANPSQVPAWVRRQHSRGIRRPVIYSSVSQMPQILGLLANDSIPRSQVRIWTAHYTNRPHLCTAECGFGFTGKADATQYTEAALGRNLDASLVREGFFS